MRKEEIDGERIFVIHDFLSPEECLQNMERTEQMGFGLAPITTAYGPVINRRARNNDRVMFDDRELAQSLWERAAPFLPANLGGAHAVGLNERLRFYRYDVGQTFTPHYDGAFTRNAAERSELTFMVYLNHEFRGGETIFHRGEWDRDRQQYTELLHILPWTGKALVFVHAQLHEGAMVFSGRKYVLRTDVMFRRTA
jgi:prolyl 4-hydroxylase